MDLTQRGRLMGVMFLMTFAAIFTLGLYSPLLDNSKYVLSAGNDVRISWGAFVEIVVVFANIATAVLVYPVAKKRNPSAAMGYVASRIVESTIIAIGIASLLAVVAMRQDTVSATQETAGVLMASKSLVSLHDATFLLGPAFCAAIGNGILLGYMLYRTELVPRRFAMLGLIGGPLALIAALGTLFNVWDQQSGWSFLFTAVEIVWELSLGIYLTAKGFKASAAVASPKGGASSEFAIA